MERLPEVERPHASLRYDDIVTCMDVACVCGATYHVDGRAAHYVRCPLCRAVFAVGNTVTLVPLTDEETEALEPLGHTPLAGELDEDD